MSIQRRPYAVGMGPAERRHWLFPPAPGSHRGIDLRDLDPSDENDRRVLIEAEHSEVQEISADAGTATRSPLHLLVHEVVAAQLWQDDPPEMWATVERLIGAGYDRHEILHMLGSAVAGEVSQMGLDAEPFDRQRYLAALAALPESWEEARASGPFDEGSPAPVPPDGSTFTHRLTDAEVSGGFVAHWPDFEPLDPLVVDGSHFRLVDGGVLEPALDDEAGEVLVGPDGWLGGRQPGELMGFRVVGDGVVVITDAEPSAPADLGERLRAAFGKASGGDGMPVPLADLVNEAITGSVGAGPLVLPPLGEVLAESGFEVRAGYAAPEGTDWPAFWRLQAAAAVAYAHGLSSDDAHALVLLTVLYHHFVNGELSVDEADADLCREVAEMVADPDLASAFVEVALREADGFSLQRFVGLVGVHAQKRQRAGVAWVRAAAASDVGDHEQAEALLRESLEADPHHAPALRDAAWYASDRGDARRAVQLLERLERFGDDEAGERASVLYGHASRPTALAGRNDPCPCGSGRKHKHCCLGRTTTAPLPDRVRWIWEKLDWFVCRELDFELDEVAAALGPEALDDDLLAASLVLFEDGAVDEFLEMRGALLPADERNLVEQWALVERSVHEVVDVEPGVGVTLRDVRTGDVSDVRERLGSTDLAVGDLICAHVVPDGVAHQMVGGIVPVPLRLRDPVVAALDAEVDSLELAELLASVWALPDLVNMEREPMVLCEARYRLSGPTAVDSLDGVLEAAGDGSWSEWVEVDGRSWIRGTVVLEGDELVVSANSEARFSRLRATVEDALPGLQLVVESSTPAAELLARGGPPLPPEPSDRLPDGAADALAAFIREQEERWLDESVPALAGLTPRQAAADPTRREQLRALLHEFERRPPPPPGAASFDVARLRAALGLEENTSA